MIFHIIYILVVVTALASLAVTDDGLNCHQLLQYLPDKQRSLICQTSPDKKELACLYIISNRLPHTREHLSEYITICRHISDPYYPSLCLEKLSVGDQRLVGFDLCNPSVDNSEHHQLNSALSRQMLGYPSDCFNYVHSIIPFEQAKEYCYDKPRYLPVRIVIACINITLNILPRQSPDQLNKILQACRLSINPHTIIEECMTELLQNKKIMKASDSLSEVIIPFCSSSVPIENLIDEEIQSPVKCFNDSIELQYRATSQPLTIPERLKLCTNYSLSLMNDIPGPFVCMRAFLQQKINQKASKVIDVGIALCQGAKDSGPVDCFLSDRLAQNRTKTIRKCRQGSKVIDISFL